MKKSKNLRMILPHPERDTPYTIEQIYSEFRKPLLRNFYNFLKDDHEWSEDLTHEVFVRLLTYSNKSHVEIDTKSLTALVSYIALRVYVDFKRYQETCDLREFDNVVKDLDGNPSCIFDTLSTDMPAFRDPFEVSATEEIARRRKEEIHRILTDEEYELLHMLYIEDKPAYDVAEIMGVQYAAIRKRHSRIKAKIRHIGDMEDLGWG